MTAESPRDPELEKAYAIADQLAESKTAHYPDDFLDTLQWYDPQLFKEFVQLEDTSGRQDETFVLLSEMDGALKAYEKSKEDKEEKEKIAPALEWKTQLERVGMTDELIGKLVNLIVISKKPILYLGGDESSLDHDKIIARSIKENYPTVTALTHAYAGAILANDQTKVVDMEKAADFLLKKGKLFVEYRKRVQGEAAKTKRERDAHEASVQEYVEAYGNYPINEVFKDAEDAIQKIGATGDVGSGTQYQGRLNEMKKVIANPPNDPKQVKEDEESARRLCAEILVAEDKLRPVVATEAPEADSAVPTTAPAASERAPEQAPEVSVDYRKDAREHPEKYYAKGTDSTDNNGILTFTPGSRAAELAIHIEDLFDKETDKASLILTKGNQEYTYKEGNAKGASWYDTNGNRLLIYDKDKIQYDRLTTPEPAAMAQKSAKPAAVPPEGSVVPLTPEQTAENERLLTAANKARDDVRGIIQGIKAKQRGLTKGQKTAYKKRLTEGCKKFKAAVAALKEGYKGDGLASVLKYNKLEKLHEQALAFLETSSSAGEVSETAFADADEEEAAAPASVATAQGGGEAQTNNSSAGT